MTADINFTKGDGYPDIVVMKWTGDEGGREQYTRRFIADGDTSIGTGSVNRAKQQAGATDGSNAGAAATEQARPGDGNGTAGKYEMITEEVLPVSLPI